MPDFVRYQNTIKPELYVLKHKDLDVAVVYVNTVTGMVEYVLAVYHSAQLPIGCLPDGTYISEWWKERAIPDSRRGIVRVLNYLHEPTNQSLMLSGYGLSLTDHYWLQPLDQEAYWADINYYENAFSDELGDLLTETGEIDYDKEISRFSPATSVNGEMKKKWVIREDRRYLLKVNFNDYGQQAVNEFIACRLHEMTGWTHYVHYELDKIKAEGRTYPCSLSPLFTSIENEFVSAYQLIRNYKIRNDTSSFEAMIQLAVRQGLMEEDVRRQLEYTILTDFILSNTDRHFNNFGFLRSSVSGKFISMAPIFDTGNSLFHNQDIIPNGENLLDLRVTSFRKREVDMLQYIRNYELLDPYTLSGFPDEVYRLLSANTCMPIERMEEIARAVEEKLKFLDMFYNGKKIWKKERYR